MTKTSTPGRRFSTRSTSPPHSSDSPREELDGPLQIVLDSQPTLDIEHVEGYPVIPRAETIEYMRENYAQFQSALAMLDRMYEDLDLDVAYRETERT